MSTSKSRTVPLVSPDAIRRPVGSKARVQTPLVLPGNVFFRDAGLRVPEANREVLGPAAATCRAGDQRTVGAEGQPRHPPVVRVPAT